MRSLSAALDALVGLWDPDTLLELRTSEVQIDPSGMIRVAHAPIRGKRDRAALQYMLAHWAGPTYLLPAVPKGQDRMLPMHLQGLLHVQGAEVPDGTLLELSWFWAWLPPPDRADCTAHVTSILEAGDPPVGDPRWERWLVFQHTLRRAPAPRPAPVKPLASKVPSGPSRPKKTRRVPAPGKLQDVDRRLPTWKLRPLPGVQAPLPARIMGALWNLLGPDLNNWLGVMRLWTPMNNLVLNTALAVAAVRHEGRTIREVHHRRGDPLLEESLRILQGWEGNLDPDLSVEQERLQIVRMLQAHNLPVDGVASYGLAVTKPRS